MTRKTPEWPEPGQTDVVWKFDEPVTVYEYGWYDETVTESVGTDGRLEFGPYAQHKRSISVATGNGAGRRRDVRHVRREWPDMGWMLIVRGQHPLPRQELIEHKYGATIDSGDEPVLRTIEEFEDWLAQRKRLEILVDFRKAAIAEGWRPSYAGCGAHDPHVPPLHLAHWYPERTVLTCSPSREEWAEDRLTHYMQWDSEGRYKYARVSGKLSDYLSPKEVAALIASLKRQRQDLQRKRREAKKQFPDFFQRKGETKSQWAHRFYDLTETERQQVANLDTERTEQAMFRAVKNLERDTWSMSGSEGGYLPEIEKLDALYDAAQKRKEVELRAKAAIDFPVDDIAWEMEVESRKAKEVERQARLQKFRNGKGGA